MREIRQSGSEGGGAGNSTGSPYPYYACAPSGQKTATPKTQLVCPDFPLIRRLVSRLSEADARRGGGDLRRCRKGARRLVAGQGSIAGLELAAPNRPNGPAERSPGLRPKADALGRKATDR